MFVIEFDAVRNLVTARMSGIVSVEEMGRCHAEIETRLIEVRPGWRLLTDLTALEKMDPGCATSVRETMTLCNSKGVTMVVRVIPDARKDIGYNLMTIFHYGPQVRIFMCETLAEAERLLASP